MGGLLKPLVAPSSNTAIGGGANSSGLQDIKSSDVSVNPSAQNAINSANSPSYADRLFGTPGAALGTAGSVYNIAGGIRSGTPTGYAGAALGAAGLANKAGAFGGASSNAGAGIGAAGSALGIYNGIKQGGVVGYGQAALNAANLANTIAGTSSALGAGLSGVGIAAAPAIYGASRNPTDLHASWWKNVEQGLQSPHDSSATPQQVGTYFNSLTALLGELDPKGNTGVNVNQALDMLAANGIDINTLIPVVGAGAPQTGGKTRQTTRA